MSNYFVIKEYAVCIIIIYKGIITYFLDNNFLYFMESIIKEIEYVITKP